MIAFACSHCGQTLSVPDDQAGKTSECTHCGGPVRVPVDVVAVEAATLTSPVNDAMGTAVYVPQTTTDAPAVAPTSRSTTDAVLFALPGYEILGELGRGGMGVIYQARQLQPRRLVAIKMILTAEHASGDALARFRSEAEAAARLSHPNIVPIYEVGEHNGRPYLTLEFVEGGSLAQKLSAGPLPFRVAVELLCQLARAVDFAHQRGIIHRDLTPANILLAADGIPKITDFGLAKHREGMVSIALPRPRTQSGAILGTPHYMAPEQAGGKSKSIGPATDVYGLGALLYECLTGRAPFQAETALDILLKVANEEPIPPRKLRPDCPRDLETIALKCLEKEPDRRYASAAALAGDLQRYLEDKPIACRPPGRLERLRRTMRRRKELVYLLTGVLATLCFGLLLFLLVNMVPTGRAPTEVREKNPLPPDLALVPRNPFAFASVRLADLWKRSSIKNSVDPLGLGNISSVLPDSLLSLLEWAGDLREVVDLEPDNVERLTFVMNDESFNSAVLLLSLRNPYNPERLPKGLVEGEEPKPPQVVEGKEIFSIGSLFPLSYCAFTEHILIISGKSSYIRALLQENARGRVEAKPPHALSLAAGSHTAVVELRPTPEFYGGIEKTLLENKLASLRELERTTLVIDLPPQARPGEPLTGLSLELALNFPSELHARPGLNETLEFLKHFVHSLESKNALPELRPLTGSLLDSLRSVNWRQEGSVVRLALQLNWTDKDVQKAARLVSAREVSQNNLKRIALALHDFSQQHQGRLPPAVVYGKDNKPLYSWRVLVLLYLGPEEKNLHSQFHLDEPWDSVHNKNLLAKRPAVYAAPWAASDQSTSGQTYYEVFVGPGAAFEGRQGVRLTDFVDGSSFTLLVAEAAEAVPWTSPQDLPYQPDKPLPRLGGHLLGGFNAVMADAAVHWIKQSVSDKTLLAAITRNGGEPLEPDW